ncbi:HD domain-containing protein [Enterobacter mori]|uniref:HD-GYP domain-containing protein n=1 Tax=Enterobacter mori TaxID=539813 RepID=UPI0021B0AA2A|nr:HD domain-containing phosphohydrolase [Enterobacter mori]MCT6664494.1 HD domain-containing protein [Enterobacter mori]
MKISVQTVLNLLHNIIHPVSADLVNHLQRTAIITWYLSQRIGLDKTGIGNAFLAGMLHDIGTLSKDREHLSPGSEGFLDGHERLAGSMTAGIRFLQPVTPILENHHTAWSSSGSDDLPVVHHLVNMADTFELYLRGIDGDFITRRERVISDFFAQPIQWPAPLEQALRESARQDGFWFRLGNPSLPQVLNAISPLHDHMLDHHDFLEVCQLISKIVDKYSSFTRTHSASVAHVAARLAELYGYDVDMQEKICIAGYLHDIGKLFTPLHILEKHGKLESFEYATMKQHSYKTLVMLHPISELGDIIRWAANHHERLDGSGYPFRLGAASLDIPSRILAVADVFTAMTENRPYRQGMESAKAMAILHEEVRNYRLDRDIVTLLDHNIGSVKALVAMC